MKRPGVSLVTGAAGFIGQTLCRALNTAGVEVRALLHAESAGPWSEAWTVDLASSAPPEAALAGVDTVFHLAARTHDVRAAEDSDALYRPLNVDATRRLVEAAARAGVARIVLFSSVKAMGEGAVTRLDESAPAQPRTAYGRSKLEAEEIVLQASAAGGPSGVVLRLPLVYGPAVKGNLARMLDAVRAGRFPPLPEGGARSLVHVDDVVATATAAAVVPAAAGRVYLITDGEDYSSRRLYESMCVALGRTPAGWAVPRSVLEVAARGGDVLGWLLGRRALFDSGSLEKLLGTAVYDDGRARRELGHSPAHRFEDSLPAMVAARLEGQRRSVE